MKKELINIIEQGMLGTLNNEQLANLKKNQKLLIYKKCKLFV